MFKNKFNLRVNILMANKIFIDLSFYNFQEVLSRLYKILIKLQKY